MNEKQIILFTFLNVLGTNTAYVTEALLFFFENDNYAV